MDNIIKEFEGFEDNYFLKILNKFSDKTNYENTIAKKLRETFNEKINEIFFVLRETEILNIESLDLNEEIVRLSKEVETKQLNERYR